MNHALWRWLKAGALMFVAVLVIAACEGPAGESGVPGKPAETAGLPPQVTQHDAVTLTAGSTAAPIALSDHFTDPDGEDSALMYSVASSAPATATAHVVSGMLVIRATSTPGTAKITVTATDAQKLKAKLTITVMVEAAPPPPKQNQAPAAVGSIPAIDLMIDETEMVDVASAFSDPDEGDTLTYTAMALDDDVEASVPAGSSTVSITGKKVGISSVTVTATDAGGLSATQMIAVTVDAPARGAAPTAAAGTSFMDMSLDAGEASDKMNVTGYFHHPDGDTMTYTAFSSAAMVATASISGGNMLQVIAGKPATSMTATITVIATDSDGQTAIQKFMVSVTADDTPPAKDPKFNITLPSTTKGDEEVALDDYLDDAEDAEDYKLVSDNSRHFTVTQKGITSVWTIKPVSRGTAKAHIQHRASGTNRETITVTILNRKPVRNPEKPDVTIDLARSTDPRTVLNEDRDDGAVYKLLYYSTNPKMINAKSYFMDKDAEDSDKLTYKFTSGRPTDVKIASGGTCMTGSCELKIDVIDAIAVGEFNLNLTATDPTGAVSETPVMIPVRLMPPLSQMYLVDQNSNGFEHMTVGYRNAKHTMVLGDWPEKVVGFYFAEADIRKTKISAAGIKNLGVPATSITVAKANGTGADDEISVMTAAPSHAAAAAAPTGVNQQVIVIKAGGRVKDIAATDLTWTADGMPMLKFGVEGVGSGWIKLTYYLWADKDGKDDATTDDDTLDVDMWKMVAEATIGVTVKQVP